MILDNTLGILIIKIKSIVIAVSKIASIKLKKICIKAFSF